MHPRYVARRLVVQVFLAGLVVVVPGGPAIAAGRLATPAPEPIRAALQSAWQRHPDYRVTQAQLAAAAARLDAADQPLYNPELEFVSDDEGSDRTTTAGVNLTLDLSGKRRVRGDAASARLTRSEAEAKLRRRDFALQWVNAWVGLEAAEQRVKTGERRLNLLERFTDLAERQFAADDISGLDRDVALLARDQAQAEQATLLVERAEASARFRTLGGEPEVPSGLALPDEIPPAPAPIDAASISQLPESLIADASQLAAERDIVVAERNRIADPTVGLRGGRIDYGPGNDNVVGISLSIPLFVRNSYRAEVVAARADADEVVAEGDKVRAQLAAERVQSVESYRATRQAWERWRSSRGTNVDRSADLLERLWREGELSTSDYLLQLNQTLDTALAGAQLRARLWSTYTNYLTTAGELERWVGLEGTP